MHNLSKIFLRALRIKNRPFKIKNTLFKHLNNVYKKNIPLFLWRRFILFTRDKKQYLIITTLLYLKF